MAKGGVFFPFSHLRELCLHTGISTASSRERGNCVPESWPDVLFRSSTGGGHQRQLWFSIVLHETARQRMCTLSNNAIVEEFELKKTTTHTHACYPSPSHLAARLASTSRVRAAGPGTPAAAAAAAAATAAAPAYETALTPPNDDAPTFGMTPSPMTPPPHP